MWANFLTIKMKNIGKNELYTELFKMLKKDKYFGTSDIEICDSIEKNEVVFSTYDGTIDERPIRKFSKKYKNEMIQVESIRVHNPFSRKPDEPKEVSLIFYKNGLEFLEIKKGYKSKIKPTFYKIEPKYYKYNKLVIETTSEKVFDLYGVDKAALDYFGLKSKTNKKTSVNIPFMNLVKFNRYSKNDETFLMEDIKDYVETKITKEEFMSNFSKRELTIFDKASK